ncbi:MAG: hypothetical protein NXI24_22790 [bacterium]|nr:hypothetical protein [bacterium]
MFALDRPGHAFGGPGIGVHPEEIVRHEAELAALGITHVRFEAGPSWTYVSPPLGASVSAAEIADYIRDHFNHDAPRAKTMREAARVLKRRDIKTILINYHLPFAWLSSETHRTLKRDNDESVVDLWIGLLQFLKADTGFVPDYIEIANEPDGHWNGHIPVHRYYQIARTLRKRLDQEGLARVQILGPGVSNLAKDRLGARWVRGANAPAMAAIAGWSFHAWDEIYRPGAGPPFVDQTWRELRAAIARQPARPIFLTEYATQSTRFGGKTYQSNGSSALYTAVETEGYALRTLVNAMIHMNRGVHVPVLWTFADRDDDRRHWGTISSPATGSYYRPVFKLLRRVAPFLPAKSRVVPMQDAPDYARCAATLIRKGEALYLIAANHSTETAQRRVEFSGADQIAIKSSELVRIDALEQIAPLQVRVIANEALQIRIPGEAIALVRIAL